MAKFNRGEKVIVTEKPWYYENEHSKEKLESTAKVGQLHFTIILFLLVN